MTRDTPPAIVTRSANATAMNGLVTPTDGSESPSLLGTDTPSSRPPPSRASTMTSFTSVATSITANGGYSRSKALEDLPIVRQSLALFLSSRMIDSEELLKEGDPNMETLYFSSGFGLIQGIKAMMSFEDKDLAAAIGHVKHATNVASQHRKPAPSITTRLAGFVIGSANSGVGFLRSMTDVERHAELVYAECLLQKAMLGIIHSGDWLQFIKEALNMRSSVGIYNSLSNFLETVDKEAEQRGEGPIDKSIDNDFRSGVYLGMGLTNLVLSLLPSTVITVVELFGYKGDRYKALELLSKAGGWTKEAPEPGVSVEDEGIRRCICDITIVIFHLVLSAFTFEGVDITQAQKILEWNLNRFPSGVIFLFGEGRLHLCRGQPAQAIESYRKAMEVQSEYAQLHHISLWEISIANFALWEIEESLKCWRRLANEATWSKAVYWYGVAVCLVELGDSAQLKEAGELMEKVPGLLQRIAGKSIPVEKFVARKAKKYKKQGGRLALPALELSYVFLGIARAPRDIIAKKMLPPIEALLAKLKQYESKPAQYENGHGYWDDFCLAHFLKGVCLRYIAFPDPDAILDSEVNPIPDASEKAAASLQMVISNGTKIELDHFLVYNAHYELGRLLACQGDRAEGRKHLQMILSGKPLEVNAAGRKGKYSMESALMMRSHAALEALDNGRSV